MKRTLSPEDKARHNAILKNRKAFEFENNSADNSADNSAANSAAIGACKHVSDRVKANNVALKRFYKDCKMIDNLPISEDLKVQVIYQLVSTIKDCFKSLEQSI